LNWIEHFSDSHQHTIAALGAFSTFAAVVVSLMLALATRRSSWTRIKANASLSTIFHATLEGEPKPEYVTVSITNVGLMPAIIPFSFFHWKVPLMREYWMINPWDYIQHDPWVPKKVYPAEVMPRASATFFVSEMSAFRRTMLDSFARTRYFRWRLYWIRALVRTDDGMIFRVKLDKSLRKELAELRRDAAIKIAT